jgi:hypothetical protein
MQEKFSKKLIKNFADFLQDPLLRRGAGAFWLDGGGFQHEPFDSCQICAGYAFI